MCHIKNDRDYCTYSAHSDINDNDIPGNVTCYITTLLLSCQCEYITCSEEKSKCKEQCPSKRQSVVNIKIQSLIFTYLDGKVSFLLPSKIKMFMQNSI